MYPLASRAEPGVSRIGSSEPTGDVAGQGISDKEPPPLLKGDTTQPTPVATSDASTSAATTGVAASSSTRATNRLSTGSAVAAAIRKLELDVRAQTLPAERPLHIVKVQQQQQQQQPPSRSEADAGYAAKPTDEKDGLVDPFKRLPMPSSPAPFHSDVSTR